MSEHAATLTRSRTSELVTAGLIVALMGAAAWITLPIGAVPVTLQVFVVVLAALLLSPATAAAAMSAYLVLGAAGLPVFSSAQGGLGVLAGPTGGYLSGFLLGAVLGALVRARLKRARPLVADAAAAVAVILTIYIVGAVQLAFVAHLGPTAALSAGVVPFIGVDVAKAVVAVAVANAVRRARADAGF